MSRIIKKTRTVTLLLSVFILISFTQVSFLASAEMSNDVDVDVSLDDEVRISLFREDGILCIIDYEKFVIDIEEGHYDFNLGQNEWSKELQVKEDEAFPHTNIRLMTELRDDEEFIGDLSFEINVYSHGDMFEVIFSFTLSDISHLGGGSIDIVKDISMTGHRLEEPEVGNEHYKFHYQDGWVGYYRWNDELSYNEETKELTFWTRNQRGLIIQGEFDGEVDEVSMEPLEIDRTHVGTTAPVPEPLDHLPSFVIGLMVGSGILIGLLAEKRREFYKKRDPEKVVKLEESYYYKGKD